VREQGLADGEDTGAAVKGDCRHSIKPAREAGKTRSGKGTAVRAADRGKHPCDAENWGTIGQ